MWKAKQVRKKAEKKETKKEVPQALSILSLPLVKTCCKGRDDTKHYHQLLILKSKHE